MAITLNLIFTLLAHSLPTPADHAAFAPPAHSLVAHPGIALVLPHPPRAPRDA